MRAYLVDILAVGFFVLEWAVYAYTLEHSAYGRDSLSARMHIYREVWVRRMLDREARMVDMQIMASLQNGTAFFASSSLIAVGGALALLRSTNDALAASENASLRYEPLAGVVGNQMRRADPDFHLRLFQIRLGVSAVQLRRHSARLDAAGLATRHAASRGARHTDDANVRDGRTALQSRTARDSFSRSAISDGSSARGSCSFQRQRS